MLVTSFRYTQRFAFHDPVPVIPYTFESKPVLFLLDAGSSPSPLAARAAQQSLTATEPLRRSYPSVDVFHQANFRRMSIREGLP